MNSQKGETKVSEQIQNGPQVPKFAAAEMC